MTLTPTVRTSMPRLTARPIGIWERMAIQQRTRSISSALCFMKLDMDWVSQVRRLGTKMERALFSLEPPCLPSTTSLKRGMERLWEPWPVTALHWVPHSYPMTFFGTGQVPLPRAQEPSRCTHPILGMEAPATVTLTKPHTVLVIPRL